MMKTERVIAGGIAVAQIALAFFLFGLSLAAKSSLFVIFMFVMIEIGSRGLDHPAGRGIRFLGWLGLVVPATLLILNLVLMSSVKHGKIVPNNQMQNIGTSAPNSDL